MSLRKKNVISVLVLAILAVAVVAGAYRLLFPPPGDYVLRAEFADSGGITKNSQVKIGGIPGGTVEEIALTKRDTALVTMRLERGAFPVGADAVANSRPVNLLGEKYIDLDVGDLARPQRSGTTIPVQRTSRPVELDDLLNTLQPGIRARMRILINEAGISMEGRGADFNELLGNLPPALDETEKVVAGFSADADRLKRLITQSDRVIGAFTREREALQDLVGTATGTLEVTADKRRELGATLAEAPAALRQLQGTLGELGTTATALEPMARQVRAVSPPLVEALTALPAFARDARPALAVARDVSPALSRLGRQAREPVRRLRPTMAQLAEFSQHLDPVMEILDRDKAVRRMLNNMNGWASATNREDGLSRTFGTRALLDQTFLEHAVDRYLNDDDGGQSRRKARKRRAGAPAEPAPSASRPQADGPARRAPKLPSLPDVKLPPLGELPPAVQDKLDDVKGAAGGVTTDGGRGDTAELFDYLFGP